jgi:hydrogenase maturation factor
VSDVDAGAGCSVEQGCITCGDVAVVLTVASIAGADAMCRDEQGREELVATELVGDVQPGDRVLVHAGVAIERLAAMTTGG